MVSSARNSVKVLVYIRALSPLLFILVLEALLHEFCGVPWELFYADDLVVTADSLEGYEAKLKIWKLDMEHKACKRTPSSTRFRRRWADGAEIPTTNEMSSR